MNEPCFYRISVKALILNEQGRFLMAREPDGTWDLLGGGLDHQEDPIAALKREITEETGLVVTHVSSAPQYFVTAERAERGIFIANVFYEVRVQDLSFTPSDECEELRFFTAHEARGVKILPNVAKFLEVYEPNARQG